MFLDPVVALSEISADFTEKVIDGGQDVDWLRIFVVIGTRTVPPPGESAHDAGSAVDHDGGHESRH